MVTKPMQLDETNQLDQLIPKYCTWFASDQVPANFRLYNEELKLTSKMRDKRLADFKASRYCAREVLSNMGISRFPLLTNEHRAPVWPTRLVGSISHTVGRCIVIATQVDNLRSIGVDVESSAPLKPELIPQIITDSENRQLLTLDSIGCYAKLIFSIKESVYKCLHPVFNRWIGFKDVSVVLDVKRNSFKIIREDNLTPSISLLGLQGRWILGQDWIYTCCWLEQ